MRGEYRILNLVIFINLYTRRVMGERAKIPEGIIKICK